jgi:hypothetical protein
MTYWKGNSFVARPCLYQRFEGNCYLHVQPTFSRSTEAAKSQVCRISMSRCRFLYLFDRSFRRHYKAKPFNRHLSNIQGDQKAPVHLMITIQKVTSNVQSVPRQSPGIYGHDSH